MLILEGIPLFLIELGIGQKMRLGSLGVWNTIHPWLGGIGISSCIVTLFVTLYYNVVITWCFFYFLNSFRVRVSFDTCHYHHLLRKSFSHRRRNRFSHPNWSQFRFLFSVFVLIQNRNFVVIELTLNSLCKSRPQKVEKRRGRTPIDRENRLYRMTSHSLLHHLMIISYALFIIYRLLFFLY